MPVLIAQNEVTDSRFCVLPLMDLRVRFNWRDVLNACIFIVVSVEVLYLWILLGPF